MTTIVHYNLTKAAQKAAIVSKQSAVTVAQARRG